MRYWPLIPGHEAAGTVAAIGKNVKNVAIGDRVAADALQPCLSCFYCTRRKTQLCENIIGYGGNVPGGMAEYCRYPAKMLTIASKAGPKLDLARELDIADSYVTISDENPSDDMAALQTNNPYGFDIVVEATGAPTVLEKAIEYVRKGGKLVVYGVYDESVKIAWSPFRIWENEITILASFCSMSHIPHVLEYVNAGRLKLGGIANKTYKIEQWEECLDAVRKQEVVKAAIVFD
ncbi:unnamed protein product [Alternaria alternata]